MQKRQAAEAAAAQHLEEINRLQAAQGRAAESTAAVNKEEKVLLQRQLMAADNENKVCLIVNVASDLLCGDLLCVCLFMSNSCDSMCVLSSICLWSLLSSVMLYLWLACRQVQCSMACLSSNHSLTIACVIHQ